QEVAVTLAKRSENANTFHMLTPQGGFRGLSPREFPKDFPRMELFKNMAPNADGNFTFAFGNNRRIGISTQTLTKQLADFFGVQEGGVLVSSVTDDSPAAKAGLR